MSNFGRTDANVRAVGQQLARIAWIGVVPLAIVAVVVWKVTAWEPVSPGTAGRGSSSESVGLTLFEPGERVRIEPIAGTTLAGDELSVATLAGHVVVLNIWGSWCAPCRDEAPALVAVANRTFDRGVRFVGVDTRDSDDAARAFVRQFDVPYPSIVDERGETLLPLSGVVPLAAVPSTVLIDEEGRVAATVIGKIDRSTLSGLIRDELRRGRGTQ